MEVRLQWKLEEAKQKEAELENDLAGMWMIVSKMKNNGDSLREVNKKDEFDLDSGFRIPAAEKDLNVEANQVKVKKTEKERVVDDLRTGLEVERRRSKEMELLVSQLKVKIQLLYSCKTSHEMSNGLFYILLCFHRAKS